MDLDFPYVVQRIAELPGHDDRAWHVVWNPTKPLLASCSADKSVRLYHYETVDGTLKVSHVNTIPTGHTKTVRAVAWAPSGKTLATASFDANIGIWEQEEDEDDDGQRKAGDWECAGLLEGHETECKSIGYSSGGNLLASCSRDKTVWIWEVQPDSDFECLAVLMEHSQDVKCVSWHPNEEILASASYDDTVKIYIDDPDDDWYCCTTLNGHTSTVWSLAWSPCGKYLASGSDDKTIRVWQRIAETEWKCVLALQEHTRSVYSISWGKGPEKAGSLGWIASSGGDGTIVIWELTQPKDESSPPEYRILAKQASSHGVHDVNTVVWCPRAGMENVLATTGDDGATSVWKVVPV